jgi:hypothetical protein
MFASTSFRPRGVIAALLLSACGQPTRDDGKRIETPTPLAAPSVAPSKPAPAVQPNAQRPPAPEPAAAKPTFGPAKLVQLTQVEREQVLAGAEDEPIAVDTHYIQSNETRHDLYFPYIGERSGAYIGVGSDQNYTLMGAARSQLAFIMDIDYRVVDLHKMYEVFIPASETPQALIERWNEPNEPESEALLQRALADEDPKLVRRIIQGYRAGRETVYRHLLRVVARKRGGQPTSWLSDEQMYAHVRAMYQTGRVRIMTGNLAGTASVRTAAAAAQSLDVPVMVLYMSNAEEYFKYTREFAANIAALGPGGESIVARTIYSKLWEHADLWAYQVQSLPDFHERLKDKKIRSRNVMFRYAERDGSLERNTGLEGFSRLAIQKTAS